MDTLEFGYLLMCRRPRLEALAIWLTQDRQQAGVAVRQALAKTWRTRGAIQSEVEVGRRLHANLRQALEQQRGRWAAAGRLRLCAGADHDPRPSPAQPSATEAPP